MIAAPIPWPNGAHYAVAMTWDMGVTPTAPSTGTIKTRPIISSWRNRGPATTR